MKLKTQQILTGTLAMLGFGSQAYADLPTTSDPSRGATDGNFIELLQNYSFDIFILAGLGLSTFAFFLVAKNVLGAYSEVSNGKGTWGAVSLHGGVGVLLLVLVVFLLTQAAGIL